MRLDIPGTSFSAWIEIDGTESELYAPEHSRDDAGNPLATCWIASQADKAFSIHWCDKSRVSLSAGFGTVDGVGVGGQFIHPTSGPYSTTDTAAITQVKISPMHAKQLLFSQLELSDEDALLAANKGLHIGEIKLKVSLVTKVGSPKIDSYKEGRDLGKSTKIHEKSKKVGVHCAKLGKEVDNKSSGFKQDIRTLGIIGTFVFRYRSLDLLQANDIAPRPQQLETSSRQSTVSPDSDQNEEDPLDSDINLLQARLDELRALKRKRVKAEPDVESVKVKREKRSKASSITSGEIIDLT